MDLIPHGTKIDFLGKSKYAFAFSFLLTVATVLIWIRAGENKYGIDFVGGHEFLVKINSGEGPDKVREAMDSAHLGNAIVQSFESGSNQYSIRLGGELGDAKTVKDQVDQALKTEFKD